MSGGVTGKVGNYPPMSIVPSMFDSSWVKVLYMILTEVKASRRRGCAAMGTKQTPAVP